MLHNVLRLRCPSLSTLGRLGLNDVLSSGRCAHDLQGTRREAVTVPYPTRHIYQLQPSQSSIARSLSILLELRRTLAYILKYSPLLVLRMSVQIFEQ